MSRYHRLPPGRATAEERAFIIEAKGDASMTDWCIGRAEEQLGRKVGEDAPADVARDLDDRGSR